jgi:large subunit ribosomal protein L15
MPLQMRLPKRGFNNISRTVFVPINLERLQAIAEKYNLDTVSPEVLVDKGIVRKQDRVKILGTGELTAKLTVTAHACSASAKQSVEAAGGSINLV